MHGDIILSVNAYQHNGEERFIVPTDFAGTKYPFYIYVIDRAKEYKYYTDIRDQVEWVLKARGGVVPQDVVDSFDKLQKIARENNVSFCELTVYALGETKKDNVLAVYEKYKDRIDNESNIELKLHYCGTLYDLYEHGRIVDTPHALLFLGKFDEAKKLYLQLKNIKFDSVGGYPTFKEAFLSDFKEFDEDGIKNAHFAELKALLKK